MLVPACATELVDYIKNRTNKQSIQFKTSDIYPSKGKNNTEINTKRRSLAMWLNGNLNDDRLFLAGYEITIENKTTPLYLATKVPEFKEDCKGAIKFLSELFETDETTLTSLILEFYSDSNAAVGSAQYYSESIRKKQRNIIKYCKNVCGSYGTIKCSKINCPLRNTHKQKEDRQAALSHNEEIQ